MEQLFYVLLTFLLMTSAFWLFDCGVNSIHVESLQNKKNTPTIVGFVDSWGHNRNLFGGNYKLSNQNYGKTSSITFHPSMITPNLKGRFYIFHLFEYMSNDLCLPFFFCQQKVGWYMYIRVHFLLRHLINHIPVDCYYCEALCWCAKELIPKLAIAKKHLSSTLGITIPDIEVRHIVATTIFLKGIGGILFVIGNTFGAFLLLVHLVLTTPLLYDFYNNSPEDPEFVPLLNDFLQSIALFGALLFFIGMKNSMPRRQLKKKTPKAKTG